MSWNKKVKDLLKTLSLSTRKSHLKTAVSFKKHYLGKGQKAGYLKAQKELTTTIEHVYTEVPKYEVHDSNIVPNTPLNFDERDRQEFSDKVLMNLPENKQPNQEQRQLIFSSSRNTLAVAGAGSGKTTSLINRLLFLHTQCKIPLEELTVFSFTKASVADFRKKFIEVFGQNGIDISDDMSERVIRTFHSKVLEMGKHSFLKGGFRIFEFLKNKEDAELSDGEDRIYKEALKEANEQVVAISELNDAQSELLHIALDKCYRKNKRFKKVIDSLFYKKLRGDMDDGEPSRHPSIIAKTNEFERQLSPLMKNVFKPSLAAKRRVKIDLKKSEYSNLVLTSDIYYPKYNFHVVFFPSKEKLDEIGIPNNFTVDGFSQDTYNLLRRKTFICKNYSKERVVSVSNQMELDALENLLGNTSSRNAHTQEALHCPIFSAKLRGDQKLTPLIDVMFSLGNFAENIGLKVKDIFEPIKNAENLVSTDKLILEATSLFWETFENTLAGQGIIRFHDLFEGFSKAHNRSFKSLDVNTKRSMSNIIIDEFQDISPEVANWIRATLLTLTHEHQETSLMCVGDDYQSIYGWRGSSPDYLTNFKKRFPSENIDLIFMNNNYRSFQSIIDTAESCLDYKTPFDKKGISNRNDNTPRLYFEEVKKPKGSEKARLNKPSLVLMNSVGRDLANDKVKDSDCDFLVMAKTNDELNKLQKSYKHKLKNRNGDELSVRFETFHRSKGLEARYCLLVEDCYYNSEHPVKNNLYSLVGFSLSYDAAQKQESMRLAYVALTRAKEKVWWIAPEGSEGSFATAKHYAKNNKHVFS